MVSRESGGMVQVSLMERSHFIEISPQLGSELQQQCFVSSSVFNLSAAWLLLMNLIILLHFIKSVTCLSWLAFGVSILYIGIHYWITQGLELSWNECPYFHRKLSENSSWKYYFLCLHKEIGKAKYLAFKYSSVQFWEIIDRNLILCFCI